MKVRHTEGCTFEGLGCVIDAFGEAVVERAVEGIQDVRLPVAKHLQAGCELRQLERFGAESEMIQRHFGQIRGFRVHKFEEGFFEEPSAGKVFAVGKHHIHRLSILYGQPISPGKQQLATSLEVLAFGGR